MKKNEERRARAKKIVAYLKKAYPKPRSELVYRTQFQFLVAVVLSAQCTDKVVNRVTKDLFKKYKTLDDYVAATQEEFEQDIKSTGFYHNKAKNIIASAKMIQKDFNGKIPDNPPTDVE